MAQGAETMNVLQVVDFIGVELAGRCANAQLTARGVVRCTATSILLLLLFVPTAFAQTTCPVIVVSGNQQILETGIASAPLVFRQEGNYISVPPVPEVQFTLTIIGDAAFASNGTRSLVASAPLQLVVGNATLYRATVPNTRIVSGANGGPIAVAVQSQLCSIVSGPALFSAFGNIDPGSPAQVVAVQGDGAVVAPGQIVPLRARVDFGSRGSSPNGSQLGVTFQIASGNGSFVANGGSSITVQIGPDGEAATSVRAGGVEGLLRVEANVAGFDGPPALFNITVLATRTVTSVSGNDQVGRPGAASQPLVLDVRSAGGAPVEGATVVWGVGFGVGPVLDATSTITDASGRTRNSFVFGPNAVESIIVATLPGGENVRFRVIAAVGGISVLSGNNQSGAIGSPADEPIVFEVINSAGQSAIGQRVDFTVLRGSAVLAAASDIVNDRGQATARFRYGNVAGPVSIQASAFSGQFTAAASANGFAAGAAAGSGNNQQGAPGSTLPQPLVVQLSQPPAGASAAKGLAGVVVAWAVTAGGGRLANATSITDSAGRASNQWTLGPAAGANTVRADVAGSSSVQFTATGVETVPSGSVFDIGSGNNQSLPTAALSAPLVVRLRTATGAPVSGVTVTWRLTPVGNGSVTPASSVTNAAGEASAVATLGLPGAAQVTATLVAGGQNPPTLVFNLNGGVLNIAGLSPRQQEVANAIDKACPALARQSQGGALTAAQQDLLARCSELVGNAGGRPTEVSAALSQMLNEEVIAQDDAAFTTASAQFDNLTARIAALRSGIRGVSLGGLAVAGGGGALPLSFLPSAIVADEGSSDEVGTDFSRWGFFASGTIGRGDSDRVADSPGYQFDTYGLTAGVDYRYSDKLVFGGALGYSDNNTDVNGDQGGLETQGYSASFYGTWYQSEAWFADAVLTWGRNSYDLTRRVRYQIPGSSGAIQSVDQVASASPDGTQLQFALSAGRDFNRGAWSFGPYARVTTTRIDFDGYVERMSAPGAAGGGLGMAVDDRQLKSLEGVLGAKASYTMSTSWGILIPHVQIEALHEFEDDPDAIVSRFANDPTGTSIVISPDAVDTDYFNLGLGLSGVFANGRSAFLYYERRAGQRDFSQDSLAVGVRIEF